MRIKLDLKAWMVILVIITITSLIIRYSLMNEKFFLDSMRLIYISEKRSFSENGSFGVAAQFFSWVNIFDIESLLGWSVYVSLVYFCINLWIVERMKTVSVVPFIFIILNLFLWYLFSVGITKEILQGVFYLCIYGVCINRQITSNHIKVVIGAMILLFSSLVFRSYYIMTAFFTVTIYLILNSFRCGMLKNKNVAIYGLSALFLAVAVFLYIASIVFPDDYEMVVTLRNTRYAYFAPFIDSFIADIFENPFNSVVIYMENYILNFARLLLPIELIFIGKLYYFPFIIYQLIFTWLYCKSVRNIKALTESSFLSLIFLTSFLIVSAMMEPDFGSWGRHQSVCWMFSLELFCKK